MRFMRIVFLLVVGFQCLNAFADLVVPFTQCSGPNATSIGYTSCAYLVVINADGSASLFNNAALLTAIAAAPTTNPDGTKFDPEDTLVGVQNNSLLPVFTLNITSANGESEFFLFDPLFPNGTPNPTEPHFGFGPTGYEGPGTSFTNAAGFDRTQCDVTLIQNPFCYSGTVNFTLAGLAPGASTYFVLEGSAATDAGAENGLRVSTVPEPGSLILLGSGLLGIAGGTWRRNKISG